MFSQFVVKKPGHNTGKKPKRFTNDLTQRHAERKILQYAMTEVDEEMNRSGFTLEPQTSCRGSCEYILIIDTDWEEDQNGEYFFNDYCVIHKWKDHHKQESNIKLNPGVAVTVCVFSSKLLSEE